MEVTTGENPLFSIIVPVYNTAKYLVQCVQSILSQNFSSLELILVDDGSTDGSSGLCDELATRDARVTVLHEKNAGVSAARNRGFDASRGRYVWFCDSDDWIEPGALEKIATVIDERSPAALCLALNRVGADGRVLGVLGAPRESAGPLDGPLQCANNLFAHSQVFLRVLGEGLRFEEDLALLEDRAYFYKLFWLAVGNTASIAEPLYNYRVEREDSAVHNQTLQKIRGAYRVSRDIYESEINKGFVSPAYESLVVFTLVLLNKLARTEGFTQEYKEVCSYVAGKGDLSLLPPDRRRELLHAIRYPRVYIGIERVKLAVKKVLGRS